MVGSRVIKKLAGSAVGVLGAAGSLLGHAGWYLRHQITGEARDDGRDV